MIHYQYKTEEAHYKPKINEQWVYDDQSFIGKLYCTETEHKKPVWVFDPRLGRLSFKYGTAEIAFFSEEHAKRFIDNPHLVEQDFVAFGNWQRFTCITCGITCLQKPYMSGKKWYAEVKQFLENHPCHLMLNEG